MEAIKRKTLLFVVVCLAAVCAKARVITVDDDGPSDFNNIQAAIDFASDSDTIIVQAGIYHCGVPTDPCEFGINFKGKNITVTSINPSDPNVVAATLIGCEDGNEVFITFRGTEEASCLLSGFNINGRILGRDWSFDPNGENYSHATISYCTLQGNSATCGTVISGFDGKILNCVIADNDALTCLCICPPIVGCHGLIKNCTIVNGVYGVAMYVIGTGITTIENCIIYDKWFYDSNDPIEPIESEIMVDSEATLNISYCYLQDDLEGVEGTVNWGPGNVIGTDPCFMRAGRWDFNDKPRLLEGDYHLQSAAGRWDPNSESWVIDGNTSPCIDAGNPGCPLGSELSDANNVRINMGAYGGTATASKSPADWRSIADLTNDWSVDFKDVGVFVDFWLESGECVPSDLDRDGSVDFADFDILGQSLL